MNPLIRSSFCLRRIIVLLAALFITVVSAHAQTLTVLHSFTSAPDGLTPLGGVIMDPGGSLYGTTQDGGSQGKGTIFRVTPTFGGITETVLHSFLCCPPLGRNPVAGLILDGAGNLYGTAQYGGSQGKGTIFKSDPSGNVTVLHNFTCCPPLGTNPVAGLIFDGAGNLYGTAQNGGDQAQDGTVFKLSPDGTLTVLHEFNARNLVPSPSGLVGDGRNPRGTLLLDASGNLYGTTYQGGTQDQGTVFKIDNAGNYSVLWSFGSIAGVADGKWPTAGVIIDGSGNLFGTTSKGGRFNGGTVFQIAPEGDQEFVVYDFGGPGDGQWPLGGLAMDANGNRYGTTSAGGAFNQGTVFRINNVGYLVLHSFNGNDGASPAAGVILGADGNLYGTTSQGGPGNGNGTGGTVFRLSLQ